MEHSRILIQKNDTILGQAELKQEVKVTSTSVSENEIQNINIVTILVTRELSCRSLAAGYKCIIMFASKLSSQIKCITVCGKILSRVKQVLISLVFISVLS
jgi:hypothetical protein